MEAPPSRLPSLLDSYKPITPTKCINGAADIAKFVRTKAFKRIMTFVDLLNASIIGVKNSDECILSEQSKRVIAMLDTLESWLVEFPPLENEQRFGNKAFRSWHEKLKEQSVQLQRNALPEYMHVAIPELSVYLETSFGNETRIDYGSGHELNFAAWLCGIAMLGGFSPDDYPAMVLRIFSRYLELVRSIQRTYTLEPAGSHGVWGLDDHQFLSYVWGSAQLLNQTHFAPTCIRDKRTVNENADEYMYLRCIQYVNQVKKGPFQEHSPLLDDIANVVSWNKINKGLAKMYVAEVLRKVPVVQHFLFGFLFPFET